MPQNRLADIIELSDFIDVPIFVVEVGPDEALTFRKLNRFHEQKTGMSSAAVSGKTPHEVLPERMADSLSTKYLNCVHLREAITYEEVLDLPNGELWWQTTLSPVIFDDGRVIGIIGTAIDITSRKQMEFREAEKLFELKKLNEEINMYTSMAAHDVRGPLRKIKVISELVFGDGDGQADQPLTLTPEQQALLQSVSAVAATALDHVDSILSYARALELDTEPQLIPLDLELIFSDLLGLVDAKAEFAFDYPKQMILAERVLTQIVLRNLLENAVKFGSSACHVSLQRDDDTPGQLMFVVSDDGPGFGDDAILGEQSANSRFLSPTNGFGLASAQRIVETRGGRMWLAPSHFGRGAGVAFTLHGGLLS